MRKARTMNAEPNTPDFTSMTGPQMLEACGDDAMQWAIAFCQTAKKLGIDLGADAEGWMVGWFANAIEHSHDVRRWRSEPQVKPVFDRFPT